MTSRSKSIAALILSVALASLVMSAIWRLWDAYFPAPQCCEDTQPATFVSCLILTLIICFTGAAVGAPVGRLLIKRGYRAYPAYAMAATCIGFLSGGALAVLMLDLSPLAYLSLLGFLCGSLFWLIRRPDADASVGA